MSKTEQAWRKAIADQVRRNCTIDWESVQKGGDHLIYAVCDWIESPPEWSHFDSPEAAPDARIEPTPDYETQLAHAYDPKAFEHHPIEERSHVAAIQWAARRYMAQEAAKRALPVVEVLAADAIFHEGYDRRIRELTTERDALREWVRNTFPESAANVLHELGGR